MFSPGNLAYAAPPAANATQSDATASIDQAMAFLHQRKFSEAKAAADKVLRLEPHSVRALAIRGTAERALGNNTAALDDFDSALALDPNDERMYLAKCLVLYDLYRLDDSIEACTKAIALDPYNVDAYDQRALSLDAKDDTAHETLAVFDVDRAIELDETQYWPFSERCELKRELKQYASAMPDCNRALALNPKHSWTWYQRAMLNLQAKDYRHAENDFRQSIATGPAVKHAYCGLAQAQAKLGEVQEALINANAYIASSPKASTGYLTRAMIYQKMKKTAEAVSDAKRAKALATTREDKAKAQALLDALERRHYVLVKF